jgi:hypothetical protein
MIRCPRCNNESLVVWNEPSMLVVPPADWPDHLAYPQQPVEEAQHLVCMACSHQEHDMVPIVDGVDDG